MIVSFLTDDKNYQINLNKSLDISIPLNFNGTQPNAYGVEKAVSTPCEAGSLVGDTRRGGSCNFEQYKFIPHCNGTHTECVGHITNERISICDCLQDSFIPAILISVEPEEFSKTDDTYPSKLNDEDKLITRKLLEKISVCEAVIVRTLPNNESKLSKTYLEQIPPFFSTEAIKFLVEIGVKHLLVDVPSIDRIFDGGKLSNHRIFWNVKQNSFETNAETRLNNTITELIYVPDEIVDGEYLLNLQIAPFVSDASPSRPLLFEKIL